MVLKILTVPNPVLRQKSIEVKTVDKKILDFIKNLEETLAKKRHPQGVGLSAPQVGKNWRVFTTQLPKQEISGRDDLAGQKLLIRTFINPQIVKVSSKLTLGPNKKKPILEGCLSIPTIYGPVWRHQWVKLRFTLVNKLLSNSVTQYLPEKTQVFSGFTARVIQHELDHLNGVLFTDRSMQQKLPLYEDRNGKLHSIDLLA